jgi:hypothetical protein
MKEEPAPPVTYQHLLCLDLREIVVYIGLMNTRFSWFWLKKRPVPNCLERIVIRSHGVFVFMELWGEK